MMKIRIRLPSYLEQTKHLVSKIYLIDYIYKEFIAKTLIGFSKF